jgi:hypothetical protein
MTPPIRALHIPTAFAAQPMNPLPRSYQLAEASDLFGS